MGKIGKISTIKKEYSRNSGSIEASLSMNGYQRYPGTGVRLVCPKLPDGRYQTGLDEKAPYIAKLRSEEEKESERQRVRELKTHLEELTGLDLSPRSSYYSQMFNENQPIRAQIVRLVEGDNIFNLEDPFQAITYYWLIKHPLIASSYQAYERGEYPASTQFYVNDDNIEQEITYKKKTSINKAIATLEVLSLERRIKVARMLGLPISDNSKEAFVYNLLDSYIKSPDIRSGEHAGMNPVNLFMDFATMEDNLLSTKDLVRNAIKHSVLRVKNGKIYNGQVEVAKDEQSYVLELMKDKNQEDLLALEKSLDSKKHILV